MTLSVCRIQVDKAEDNKFGTGFLCEIQVKNKLRYGIVTNYHLIENAYSDYLRTVKVIFKQSESEQDEVFYLNDENIGNLRASYSDIDAAFIELSEQFQNQLRKSERKFLETDTNLNEDDKILVIQYSAHSSEQILSFSTGQILDSYSQLVWDLPFGCELHTAPTLEGSSGSPVLINGKVFGIHRGSSKHNENNTLVRVQFLIEKLNGETVEDIVPISILK